MMSGPFGDKFSVLTLKAHDSNLSYEPHSKTPNSVLLVEVIASHERNAHTERVRRVMETLDISRALPRSTALFFQVIYACPFISYIEAPKTFRSRRGKMRLICRREGSVYEDSGERGGGTASRVFKISSLKQMTQFHTYCPRKSSRFP